MLKADLRVQPIIKLMTLSLIFLVTSAIASSVIKAAEKTDEASEQQETTLNEIDIEPEADKILKEMGDFLKNQKEFSVKADVTFDQVEPSGEKLQYSATNSFVINRPNKIYAQSVGDIGEKRFWYDGKGITLLDIDKKVYAQEKAPSNIDATLDHLMEDYGFSLPLADFVFSDPYSDLIENVKDGYYLGLHNVRGMKCNHLAFVQENLDWQLWVKEGKEPVPCKIVITYKDVPSLPQYSAVFTDWNFGIKEPDSKFKADSLGGAEKIEFLKIKKQTKK
jgi:hypothetical protein